jgi:hypothetical protein
MRVLRVTLSAIDERPSAPICLEVVLDSTTHP